MMRSMFSGVSGLRIHQTKMDVIANNISNVNTVGYKSSRVTFNEVFNQTLSGASGPNDARNRGGVNPMQIGLGAGVASIDKLMTTGAAQRTDNPLDLMIQGDGFFVVGDITGRYFTRAGNFIEDRNGFLSLNGLKLMGWDSIGDEIQRMAVQPLQITPEKQYLNPTATSEVIFVGNINPNTDPVVTRSMSFFDSVGTRYVIYAELRYNADNSTPTQSHWDVFFRPEIFPNGDMNNGIPVTIEPAGTLTPPEDLPPPTPGELQQAATIVFDTNGILWSVNDADRAIQGFNLAPVIITPTEQLVPAATLGITNTYPPDNISDSIFLNFSGLNQFVNEGTNALIDNVNGNEPGRLSGLSVGSDGKLTGRYTNGLTRLLGQIPLAQFKNPAGLEKMGDNLFVETQNSGRFDGVGSDGEVMGGVLEMSNVDLSQEFTEMITTQRGFQANSRIISASDQMLQELVNLVR